MARNINDIEKELMTLPDHARERIAHDLIISLDKGDEPLTHEEWDAAWLEEIKRREADIREGRVERLDGDQVLAELKAKYTIK